MRFETFLNEVIFDNPIVVNRETTRYVINLPNGVIAYYNEVIPYNFLKKPYSYVFLNIQISENHLELIKKIGGTLEDIYCSEGFGVPKFTDKTNTFKCLEMAYKFALENKKIFSNETVL